MGQTRGHCESTGFLSRQYGHGLIVDKHHHRTSKDAQSNDDLEEIARWQRWPEPVVNDRFAQRAGTCGRAVGCRDIY